MIDELKFVNFDSIHKEAIRDKKLRRKWNVEKLIRLQSEKNCPLCNMQYSKTVIPILHHTKMDEKMRAALINQDIITNKIIKKEIKIKDGKEKFNDVKNNLIDYYKSLQDTKMICNSCHARIHGNIMRQTKNTKF